MKKMIYMFCLSAFGIVLLSACSTTQKITHSSRTATEQLLISEALMRSLPKQADLPVPIPRGAVVKLDVTGMTSDKDMARGIIAGWLGLLGYAVQDGPEDATHRINIVVDALGTEMGSTFFGIPPIRASLIPISLPELALFKAEHQGGYTKFHLDVFEMPSGRFIASSSPFLGDTSYSTYTVLFLISFTKTDLTSPPRIGHYLNH